MFAFIEYTVSLTYTLLLVILRNTLEKKKTLCTKHSLNKKTDHILAVHSDETEEHMHMVLKAANSHMYLKTFLKIQNSRKSEHEFSDVELFRIFHS